MKQVIMDSLYSLIHKVQQGTKNNMVYFESKFKKIFAYKRECIWHVVILYVILITANISLA